MAMTVAEFRREAARRRGARRRGTPRYSDQLVAFAVEHAQAARAAGASVNAVATELGLSWMTLSSWLSRSGHGGHGRLREVVVSESSSPRATPQGLTVTTASGHVVSGLDVSQAAALLRALS